MVNLIKHKLCSLQNLCHNLMKIKIVFYHDYSLTLIIYIFIDKKKLFKKLLLKQMYNKIKIMDKQ